MVVKKFGYRSVPDGAIQQNGYVIKVSFVTQTFGSCRLHSHRNLCSFESQIAWVLYGQASRAISIG